MDAFLFVSPIDLVIVAGSLRIIFKATYSFGYLLVEHVYHYQWCERSIVCVSLDKGNLTWGIVCFGVTS